MPYIIGISGKYPVYAPHKIHQSVTQPTHPGSIKHVDNYITQEKNMLTEVDIERIMAAKRQLAESVADDSDFELVDDAEIFELMDDDIPVTETNGLM